MNNKEKLVKMIGESNLDMDYKKKIVNFINNGSDEDLKKELSSISKLIAEIENSEESANLELENISNENISKIEIMTENFANEINNITNEISKETNEITDKIKIMEIENLKENISLQ